MIQKLSQLPAPTLAGVVRERDVQSAVAEIRNCMYDGATMIDLHMSCLESCDTESLKRIIKPSKLPVLALNYNNTYEWGDAGFTEEERVKSFLRAVEVGAAGIDMQGYTFDLPSKKEFCGEDKYSFTKGNPKEVVTDGKIISKQCELIERVHSMGAEVLLSCHPGIPMNCGQVVELALFLEKRNPDIIKIVTRADSEDDLAESIRAMLLLKKEVKIPVSYHVSGNAGMLSRIINPLIGGQIAFCVDRYQGGSILITAWILTHGHEDHYGAFLWLTKKYGSFVRVRYFLFNPVLNCREGTDYLCSVADTVAAAYPAAERVVPHTGMKFRFCGLTLEILFTHEDILPLPVTSFNDSSTVTKVTFSNGVQCLIMGDMQSRSRTSLLQNVMGEYLKSDILQVPHHGDSGGTEGLYELIDPSVVIYSTSNEKFERISQKDWTLAPNAFLLNELHVKHTIIADERVHTVFLEHRFGQTEQENI